jgi:hypothetical protein
LRIALGRTRIPFVGGPSPVDSKFRNPNSLYAQALRGRLSLSEWRRLITDANTRTRSISLVKPGRRLGGAWIDQFVAQGTSVSLCAECGKRYSDWQEKAGYDCRDQIELTDCDGCGQELMRCRGWYKRIRPPN